VEDEMKKNQTQPKEKQSVNKIPYSSSKNVLQEKQSPPSQALVIEDDDLSDQQQQEVISR
jgi:hypothetical protein